MELPEAYIATQRVRPPADENLAAIRGYSNQSSQSQPHVTFDVSSIEPSERSIHDHGLSLLEAPSTGQQGIHQSPAESHFSNSSRLPGSNSLEFKEDCRPLLERVRAALRKSEPYPWPQQPEQWFLPPGELHRIIQPHTVRQCLHDENISTHYPMQDIVDYVCAAQGNVAERHHMVGARRLFCILLLIEKLESIIHFYREGLYDGDLPLQKKQTDQYLFQLVKSDGVQLSCFSSWNAAYLGQFDERQWWTLAPFLTDDSEQHNTSLYRYRLDDRAVLPWNNCGSPIPGHASEVRMIDIHPSHHKFGPVRESLKIFEDVFLPIFSA